MRLRLGCWAFALLLCCSGACAWTPASQWRLLHPFSRARPGVQQAQAPQQQHQHQHQLQQGYAVWDEQLASFRVQQQQPSTGTAPAWANYSHASNHKSGFGQLRVSTDAAFANELQLAAAGFVEGWLTAPQIADHWHNIRSFLTQQTSDLAKVYDWLMAHHAWVTHEAARPAHATDPFWQALRLVLAQAQGVFDGYNARAVADGSTLDINPISLREFLTLQTMGDIDDILELLFPDDPSLGLNKLEDLEPAALAARLATRGRCSVLIRVTPDLSDILISHATWYTYLGMTRIYKHYDFAVEGEQFVSRRTSMSSYPGMISSMDDFYILGSHLVVTETSNSILDPAVWHTVVPQAALSWQRVLAANWLSASGTDWAHWISKHNSGTYNNQYMVVDLNRFAPFEELQPGLLRVVEQMPGLVVSADKTQALERGYWPSYNIPYFAEVYNRSGYPQFRAKLQAKNKAEAYASVVSGLSYQLAPRAKISRRDQGSVNSLEGLKAYIRSNRWVSDPLSGASPHGAICSRGDLDPTHPRASGCNDAKVTSYWLAMHQAAEAVNGPTPGDGGKLGPFSWSKSAFPGAAHRGMPDTFAFDFELQQP